MGAKYMPESNEGLEGNWRPVDGVSTSIEESRFDSSYINHSLMHLTFEVVLKPWSGRCMNLFSLCQLCD